MNWCCVFHVTHDKLSDMRMSSNCEVIGHNQWKWTPQAFFDAVDLSKDTDYRFIHFYRQPFRKIISGYRYHLKGAEEW